MDHECDGCCDGVDSALAIQREMMKKHGWCYHYVTGRQSRVVNIHTHGFMETFGHEDMQIVAPLGEVAGDILYSAVNLIKAGKKFEHNDYVTGIVKGYEVKIVQATEGDRRVLRIIIPDKEGHLERFNLTEPFDLQYSDLPVE